MIKYAKILTAFVTSLLFCNTAFAGDDHDINLKLFGKNVIENYDGCRFALWQENRDPDTDKFAYIFFAPFNDGEVLPGWMKIGEKVHEFERQDVASKNGLFDAHQLYKSNDGDLSLIMEIKVHSTEGDVDFISDARVTVVQDEKFPFTSSKLQGHIFCPQNYETTDATQSSVQYGELYGGAISLYGKEDHSSFNAVPAPMIQYIRNELTDCDLNNVPEYATSYKISEDMTFWEIPCALYARNAASVYATALNNNPDFFVFLTAVAPPGLEANDRFDILNASINPKNATISSFDLGPGSDCGTYEVHQLRAVEGEAIELQLAEFRDKPDCDGAVTDAVNFPLVYSAR